MNCAACRTVKARRHGSLNMLSRAIAPTLGSTRYFMPIPRPPGAHADGHYGPWNLQFETMRYAHNPENSAGGADDTITCGAFAATNPVASEGVLLVANVAHDFRVNWGLYPGFSATTMTACYSRTTTGLMIPC